jgi:hypothetical protein
MSVSQLPLEYVFGGENGLKRATFKHTSWESATSGARQPEAIYLTYCETYSMLFLYLSS